MKQIQIINSYEEIKRKYFNYIGKILNQLKMKKK